MGEHVIAIHNKWPVRYLLRVWSGWYMLLFIGSDRGVCCSRANSVQRYSSTAVDGKKQRSFANDDMLLEAHLRPVLAGSPSLPDEIWRLPRHVCP